MWRAHLALAMGALVASVIGAAAPVHAQTACGAGGITRGCWQHYTVLGSNYSTSLDVTEGMVCVEGGVMSGNGDNKVSCAKPGTGTGFTDLGFIANGGAVPGGVDSIAIFNTKTTTHGTHIHILGGDNIVRTFRYDSAQTWYSQASLINPISTTLPQDVDSSVNIDIVEIAAVDAGWLGGDRHVVQAVSSTGVAYVQHGNKWRKHPRLNDPSRVFKRVSSLKPAGGSYWVTSTGAIWLAYDLNSLPGPTLAQLPSYSGKIRDIGYPYILTNDGATDTSCNPLTTHDCYVTCNSSNNRCNGDLDRVRKLSGSSWVRSPAQTSPYSPGMPGSVPVPSGGGTTHQFGPKNGAIVDARAFRGVAGEYFLHHFGNRWYVWIPN